MDESSPESSAVKLNLLAPLFYAEAPGLVPFACTGADEQLFCFALDPAQSRSIEPDRERLLGELLFAAAGQERSSCTAAAGAHAELPRRLPAGVYLFIQRREALGREACIDLAIEQQKDGLWERLKPENKLYVRYLFEDGKPVTQLFRPLWKH